VKPKAYVVTQGPANGEVFKRCLPERLTSEVYFAQGGGWSSAMSLAGSILAVKERPVALVVDAESEHEAVIEERRGFTRSFLRQTSVAVPFEVFLAIPEIEVLLFQSKPLLSRLTDKTISDVQFEAARHHPKKWLAAAGIDYPKDVTRLLNRLTEEDLATLRSHELIRGLSDFLTRVLADNASPPGRDYRRTVQI